MPGENPCVPIKTISVEGATLLSSHQVRAITQAHEGQCLTLGGINMVLQELTNAYIQKGYVGSRAVLEPQDLSLGVLHIRVIEGRVESIEMSPGSTMYKNIALLCLFALLCACGPTPSRSQSGLFGRYPENYDNGNGFTLWMPENMACAEAIGTLCLLYLYRQKKWLGSL